MDYHIMQIISPSLFKKWLDTNILKIKNLLLRLLDFKKIT